jgi:hypothetical protein
MKEGELCIFLFIQPQTNCKQVPIPNCYHKFWGNSKIFGYIITLLPTTQYCCLISDLFWMSQSYITFKFCVDNRFTITLFWSFSLQIKTSVIYQGWRQPGLEMKGDTFCFVPERFSKRGASRCHDSRNCGPQKHAQENKIPSICCKFLSICAGHSPDTSNQKVSSCMIWRSQ